MQTNFTQNEADYPKQNVHVGLRPTVQNWTLNHKFTMSIDNSCVLSCGMNFAVSKFQVEKRQFWNNFSSKLLAMHLIHEA